MQCYNMNFDSLSIHRDSLHLEIDPDGIDEGREGTLHVAVQQTGLAHPCSMCS